VLDGFPRNIAQAEALERALAAQARRVAAVLYIKVPERVLIERVSGRRMCRECGESYHVRFNPPKKPGACDVCGGELYQRDDDRPETVQQRLRVYDKQTRPLVDFYGERDLLVDIDGDQSIDDVTAAILAAIPM
jgi:adenylate kinase